MNPSITNGHLTREQKRQLHELNQRYQPLLSKLVQVDRARKDTQRLLPA